MSLSRRDPLDGLHPLVRDAAEIALAWAAYYDIDVEVTSGYRSCAEQAELRRNYELGLSRFPANRPGDSAHNYGLAWDSVAPPTREPDWWAIRRWVGFNVPENDRIHAEVPAWRDFVLRKACALPG